MMNAATLDRPRALQSLDMPPRHNERGAETRDKIMRVIRQRSALDLPPATLRGLARDVGRDASSVHAQLATLVELGELERAEVAEGVIVYRLPSPRE